MSIIVAGNPADGFTFFGPFDDRDEASEWAGAILKPADWWVVDLTAPSEES